LPRPPLATAPAALGLWSGPALLSQQHTRPPPPPTQAQAPRARTTPRPASSRPHLVSLWPSTPQPSCSCPPRQLLSCSDRVLLRGARAPGIFRFAEVCRLMGFCGVGPISS
jgi:hypothetical protein